MSITSGCHKNFGRIVPPHIGNNFNQSNSRKSQMTAYDIFNSIILFIRIINQSIHVSFDGRIPYKSFPGSGVAAPSIFINTTALPTQINSFLCMRDSSHHHASTMPTMCLFDQRYCLSVERATFCFSTPSSESA